MDRCKDIAGYTFQEGFVVQQNTVGQIKLLDPDSVEVRRSHLLRRQQYKTKGPNALWHMDSYYI